MVAAARKKGVILGVDHPLRLRPELKAIADRVESGAEVIHMVAVEQFVRNRRVFEWRDRKNAGDDRAWMDNLLWHNMAHGIDAGLWLLGGEAARVVSWMSRLDEELGIPMDAFVGVESGHGAFLSCSASYFGRDIYQITVVTDRDTYRFDQRNSTFTSSGGVLAIDKPFEHLHRVTRDFVEAVESGREPGIPGWAVLPSMRVIQEVQDRWDKHCGARGESINGRPLTGPTSTPATE